ncbi:MAG: DUF4336 domain-containing protein [Tabrizicola sp.]|jgi:hypothetical protein|nr:DUF4336 domain-containing protein [Tabrizicola sp.]
MRVLWFMEMLHSFAPDLWLADGPTVNAAAGFAYPTRMAVIKLSAGGLVLLSPVAPGEALCAAVGRLGPVHHLIAPNKLHNLFIGQWKAAFPAAIMHAAPGLRDRRPDLAFDADITDTPHPDWAGQIDQTVLHNRIADEAVFFHRESGTALFTDLLQGLPPGWFSGWRSIVARLDGMTGPEPRVPRKFRLAFTDRKALRQAMATVLGWPVKNVVMAHGTPITSDARAYLARAFAWSRP